jgi:hypothetical protein
LPKLTHYLTLGALLTHLLLGCCWHHAHDNAPQVASADHDDHPCGSHEQPGRRHHDPQQCQQGKCVFVRPSHDQLTCTPLGSCQAFALSAPNADLVAVRFPGHSLPPTGAHLGPLRLHLLNQILLI